MTLRIADKMTAMIAVADSAHIANVVKERSQDGVKPIFWGKRMAY